MTGPWIASMLDPSEDVRVTEVLANVGWPRKRGDPRDPEDMPVWDEVWNERDDRDVREKIEDQREADFYREDPDELPLDVEGDDGAS
jgi:hypothetical protein